MTHFLDKKSYNMKRDHQSDQEQDQDDGNSSNHSSGQKRFRNNDEILRVLIPSRVSHSLVFFSFEFIFILMRLHLSRSSLSLFFRFVK